MCSGAPHKQELKTDEFFPDQRYTINGEPELAFGILKEVGKRQIKLYLAAADEKRTYTINSKSPYSRKMYLSVCTMCI